eukprot:scaffold97966_cov36-Phaeocystis_antarctica.AAC.1
MAEPPCFPRRRDSRQPRRPRCAHGRHASEPRQNKRGGPEYSSRKTLVRVGLDHVFITRVPRVYYRAHVFGRAPARGSETGGRRGADARTETHTGPYKHIGTDAHRRPL